MARKSGIWFRKHDGWYYTTIRGEKHKLARAEKVKGKITPEAKAVAKKEAEREFHRLMAELPPDDMPPSRVTFHQVANAFLEDSEKNNAPDTYRGHKRFLKSFCRFLHSKTIRPQDLRPYQVYRWVGLHESWSPSTRRVAMNVVQACLNWGVRLGYVTNHELGSLDKPPAQARDSFVTPEQQTKIFSQLRHTDPFREYLFGLIHSGCRPSEVAAVQVENFDAENGVWVMEKHKTRKKTGRSRVVYLTPELLELCKRLAEEVKTGPLFRNRDGRPWKRSGISYRLRKLAEELEIPGLSSYLFRHAFITNALERGLSDTMVAELCGNSPITIRRHYNHLSSKVRVMRDAAARAVGGSTAGVVDRPEGQ